MTSFICVTDLYGCQINMSLKNIHKEGNIWEITALMGLLVKLQSCNEPGDLQWS